MNRQIASLFRLSAVAFAVLITFTAYWQIWAADSLATRRDNARLVYRQLQIKRGLIYAANGHTVLAANHERHRNGLKLFLRHYPFGPLFAHAVGYNTVGNGRTGIELAENDYLTASNNDLATVVSRIGSELQGETVTGDNVVTSLSVAAQRAAATGMQGKVGAVVGAGRAWSGIRTIGSVLPALALGGNTSAPSGGGLAEPGDEAVWGGGEVAT